MNASILPETANYAAAVRAALADLPADEVEDLTEGLEADLAESWQESGGQPLIDPTAYAHELRLAAGLPEAVPAVGKLARLQAATKARLTGWGAAIRRNPAGVATLDFLASLQPAWWVLRGYLAYFLGMALAGLGIVFIPTDIFAVGFLLVMILGSIWVGTRNWGPMMRVLVLAGNVLAIFVLTFATSSIDARTSDDAFDDRFAGNERDLTGVYFDGNEVTNLFAYDANGTLIPQVQLFDQDGNPLITSVEGGSGCLEWVQSPETADWDGDCPTVGVWVPTQLETGAPAWNVFPMLMVEQSDIQGGEPKEGAEPVVAKPPFVKVPALGVSDQEAQEKNMEPGEGSSSKSSTKKSKPKKN